MDLKLSTLNFEREQPMTWKEDTSYIQDPDALKCPKFCS